MLKTQCDAILHLVNWLELKGEKILSVDEDVETLELLNGELFGSR